MGPRTTTTNETRNLLIMIIYIYSLCALCVLSAVFFDFTRLHFYLFGSGEHTNCIAGTFKQSMLHFNCSAAFVCLRTWCVLDGYHREFYGMHNKERQRNGGCNQNREFCLFRLSFVAVCCPFTDFSFFRAPNNHRFSKSHKSWDSIFVPVHTKFTLNTVKQPEIQVHLRQLRRSEHEQWRRNYGIEVFTRLKQFTFNDQH